MPGAAEQLHDVYLSGDYFALAAQLGSLDPHDPQRSFFEGQLDAAFLRNDEARRELRHFLDLPNMAADWRKEAWRALVYVEIRLGEYEAAARDLGLALAEPAARCGAEKAREEALLAMLLSMRGVPPQSRSDHSGVSSVTATWGEKEQDRGGWVYLDFSVNHLTEQACLDTGANFSVASSSFARRHKLRMISEQCGLTVDTARRVPARLGIADEVRIGQMCFHHVVFFVCRDEDLAQIGNDAVIGLPLISAFGRLRVPAKGGFSAEIGFPPEPASPTPVQPRNLAVDRFNLLVGLEYQGIILPFVLDTGDNETNVYTCFGTRFPQVLSGSLRGQVKRRRIGSQSTIPCQCIARLGLDIDGRPVCLHDVAVLDHQDFLPLADGKAGGDLLEGGYELDFRQMHLSLLGGTQPKSLEPPQASPSPSAAP